MGLSARIPTPDIGCHDSYTITAIVPDAELDHIVYLLLHALSCLPAIHPVCILHAVGQEEP